MAPNDNPMPTGELLRPQFEELERQVTARCEEASDRKETYWKWHHWISRGGAIAIFGAAVVGVVIGATFSAAVGAVVGGVVGAVATALTRFLSRMSLRAAAAGWESRMISSEQALGDTRAFMATLPHVDVDAARDFLSTQRQLVADAHRATLNEHKGG